MKKQRWNTGLTALAACTLLAACDNSETPVPTPPVKPSDESYVISAAAGEANYLLTAESLENGSVPRWSRWEWLKKTASTELGSRESKSGMAAFPSFLGCIPLSSTILVPSISSK